MKKTITFNNFVDEFNDSSRKDSFSYDGLKALYEYFEEMDEGMELDIVAIDCEYTEYESIREAYEVYQDDYEELCEDEEERDERANEYLNDNTQVIHMDNGGVIIANF